MSLFRNPTGMWRESGRSKLVQESHGKCGGSLAGVSLFRNPTGNVVESQGSLILSALDRMLLPNAIVLAN